MSTLPPAATELLKQIGGKMGIDVDAIDAKAAAGVLPTNGSAGHGNTPAGDNS